MDPSSPLHRVERQERFERRFFRIVGRRHRFQWVTDLEQWGSRVSLNRRIDTRNLFYFDRPCSLVRFPPPPLLILTRGGIELPNSTVVNSARKRRKLRYSRSRLLIRVAKCLERKKIIYYRKRRFDLIIVHFFENNEYCRYDN